MKPPVQPTPSYKWEALALLWFAFLTGACSPYALGQLKPTLGLARGLASLGFVYLLGAIAIAWGVFAACDRLASSSAV